MIQWQFYGIIAAGAFAAGIVSGAYWNGARWENKWNAREIQYQAAVIAARDQSEAQRKRTEALYDDKATEYEAELARLQHDLDSRSHRRIVCNKPAPILPGAGPRPAPGGPDAIPGVSGTDTAATGTIDADELLAIGGRCDAQVIGLQGLLR